MTPNSNPAIRELLETRLDGLSDGQHLIQEAIVRLEGKVDKTNGRVTGIELREAMAKAALEEHRRMEAERQRERDAQQHKSEKWIGIFPAIIASVASSLTTALVLLLFTGQL